MFILDVSLQLLKLVFGGFLLVRDLLFSVLQKRRASGSSHLHYFDFRILIFTNSFLQAVIALLALLMIVGASRGSTVEVSLD